MEKASRKLFFILKVDHIEFIFPSGRIILIQSEPLRKNSEFFENFIQVQETQKLQVSEIECINLDSLDWAEINEDLLVSFINWLGLIDATLDWISPAFILFYTIFADYFQVSQAKVAKIISEVWKCDICSNFEAIEKYWSTKYIQFTYVEIVLDKYLDKIEDKWTEVLKEKPRISVKEFNTKINPYKAYILRIALKWIDDVDNEDLEGTTQFVLMKDFITKNSSYMIPTSVSELINVLNLFKSAHKAVDMITALNCLNCN